MHTDTRCKAAAILALMLLLGCNAPPATVGPPLPSASPSASPSSTPSSSPVPSSVPTPFPDPGLPPLPVPVASLQPLRLPPVALLPGQERHLSVDEVSWSPDRSRFVYHLRDSIYGEGGRRGESLRLRVQASQQDTALTLPPGSISRVWWLDGQTLAVLLQQSGPPLDSAATQFGLYRLRPGGEPASLLRRFDFDGQRPEVYSLRAQGSQLLFVGLAKGKLQLHALDGLSGQEQQHATELAASRYNAGSAHRLYMPAAGQWLLLAGRQPASTGSGIAPARFELHRFEADRADAGTRPLETGSLEQGAFSLSADGRYLLQGNQLQDLLPGGARRDLAIAGDLMWWNAGRLFGFDSAARPPLRMAWADPATGLRAGANTIDYSGSGLDSNPDGISAPLYAPLDRAVLYRRGSSHWLLGLDPSLTAAKVARLDLSGEVNLLSDEPSAGSLILHQLEQSPLTPGATAPLRLRLYGLDGAGGRFYPLLDIQAQP